MYHTETLQQNHTYLAKELNFHAVVINLLPLKWFYRNLKIRPQKEKIF